MLLFLQPGLLGVFQKLIASKANDHQGFYLLNSIVEHMPPWVIITNSEIMFFFFFFSFCPNGLISSISRESINQYRKQIFILLFQRLQSSKTTKFIKSKLKEHHSDSSFC